MTTHKSVSYVEELVDAHAEIARLKAELTETRAALAKYEPPDPKPPPGYGEVLDSKYQLLLRDKGCNEPIGWGFQILKKLEDKALADALKTHGDIEFLHDAEDEDLRFGLIVRWLTEAEAVAKYGPRGAVEFGPRGGFRQVMYGTKAFNHRRMRPAGVP